MDDMWPKCIVCGELLDGQLHRHDPDDIELRKLRAEVERQSGQTVYEVKQHAETMKKLAVANLQVEKLQLHNTAKALIAAELQVRELKKALETCLLTLGWVQSSTGFKRWTDHDGVVQDPCGVNSCLEKYRKLIE